MENRLTLLGSLQSDRPCWILMLGRPIRLGPGPYPPPEEWEDDKIVDLTYRYTSHPDLTFLFRVSGTIGDPFGLEDGWAIFVDRSRTPVPGEVVVLRRGDDYRLNRWDPDLDPTEEPWGVVITALAMIGGEGEKRTEP